MIHNVLVSGGGVAGLALAHWLTRAGMDVTVVERTPAFRRGGQAIDIRGVALDVVRAMGILDRARELRTRNEGMSMLDAQGVERERITDRTFSSGRLDSDDIELFRDDLCELLIGTLGERATLVYDDGIRAIVDTGDGVNVVFENGARSRFDLVIGTDGVYSKTRRLLFDDEAAVVNAMGVVLALFTTPNVIGLERWELMYRADGIGYVVYPSRDQTTLRVSVGFGSEGREVGRNDVAAQKAMVASACAGLGGHMPAFLQAMATAHEFYYNELAQIRMPQWSKGRVALAGDAAHCASPFSGQGTSLALVGAFVLARELARDGDHVRAFEAYEERMRPYVRMNQDMVDPMRKGPIPDEVMTRAKQGIDLSDLLREIA